MCGFSRDYGDKLTHTEKIAPGLIHILGRSTYSLAHVIQNFLIMPFGLTDFRVNLSAFSRY